MSLLLFGFYRFLLVPFGLIALPFVALFNAKIRKGLKLRRAPRPQWTPSQAPIWIHASSGEFEYAKAVIREIKARQPEQPILVTFFSPSYAEAIRRFPGVDYILPLPLDLPGPTRAFLRRFRPQVLLLARTDLWPEILWQCRRMKVPVLLFSYTQAPIRRIQIFKRGTKRWLLNWTSAIFCVSADDQKAVDALGVSTPIHVLGDTRYDQVEFRLNQAPAPKEALQPAAGLPCLVAGSTWPEDETPLLEGVREFLTSDRLRLILVPHEPTPEHVQALEARLAKLGLTSVRSSSGIGWQDRHVLLVDQTGLLAELYKIGQFAFVGGSFRKTVHSVMEPLGAGCLTFVGPYFHNNREAVQFSEIEWEGFKAVEAVRSASELKTELERRLSQPEKTVRAQVALRAEFAKRLGASRKLVDEINFPALS